MTTTVTKDQLETLSTADNGQAVSETKKYTGEFEGKFIGTLVGNATTAKQLEQPYNFSLAGDAEGTVAVNASSVVLNTTVNHATEADTADFAGKTNLAARATLADMANTAEFAYRAGRLSNLLIKLHGGVTGSGQLTNADTMDIAISGVDVSYFFVFSALPEKNPDITKAYVDLSGHHFWIYDTANTVWKDAYEYLTKTLELHGQRLDVLEKSKTTNTADIETLKSTVSQQGAKLTNHEDRITVNEKGITAHDARITANATDISALDKRLTAAEKLNTSQSESLTDHEKRIGNIETTTDVGQISTRVQAIEDKNVEQDEKISAVETKNTEQDTALENETKARTVKEALLTAKDEEIENSIVNLSNKYVTLDTSQVITGNKVLTTTNKRNVTVVKITNNDNTITPTESLWTNAIMACDKNNKGIGALQFSRTTGGANQVSIQAANQNANGKDITNSLAIRIKDDGTIETYAPTPASSSSDNSIATTNWVNNKITTTNKAQDAVIDLNYEVNSFVEKLSLRQLYSDYLHANVTTNDRSIQGVAVNGHVIYYTICKTDNSSQELHQIDLDKQTHSLLKTYTELGHTNSMMYYNNKLYVVTGITNSDIKVVNLISFAVEQTLNVKDLTNTNNKNMVGIAYDDVNDKFVGRGADGFYIINPTTFKTVEFYTAKPSTDSTGVTNVATQGITCHNGLYYCNNCFNLTAWSNSNPLGINVVSVYNKSKLVHTFFIANTYGEIEDIDFIDDQLVITSQRINGNTPNGFSYYIYKANIYKNPNNFSEWDGVQRNVFSDNTVSAVALDNAIYVNANANRFKPQLGTKDYPFYSLDDAIAYASFSKFTGRVSFRLKGDFYSKNKPVLYVFGHIAKALRITNWTDSESDPDGYTLPSVQFVSAVYTWIQYGTIKQSNISNPCGIYINNVHSCLVMGMKILNPDKINNASGIRINYSSVAFIGSTTTINGFNIGIHSTNSFYSYQGLTPTITNCTTQRLNNTNTTLFFEGLPVDRIVASENNKYIRYQSGLQICCTSVQVPKNSVSVTWTYPLAFKATPVITSSVWADDRKIATISTPTATSVKLYARRAYDDANLEQNTTVHAIAIGYWK